MDLQLTGHNAVIIGGASGLGAAIANAFRENRATVVIVDRKFQKDRIGSDSESSELVADVTDLSAVEAARDQVMNVTGRCDHLVYAAGIGSGHYGFPFWNVPPNVGSHVLDVNLIGAVNTAHAFHQPIIDSQGTICFISSVAGQMGSQTDPPYSAAKAGLINFSQCAAKDFAPFGVRVNTICPGMIKTALNESVYQAWADRQPHEEKLTYETWADEKVRRVVPLGRWQTAEDVAAMALFLASSSAINITGQTLNVDGGFVMHS